jgi:NAD(P)-dependent dehydrogenase (short-subunit alcohol dehydrogenase family)
MKYLTNKTVAITGSTGGIGRELCAHVAVLGASELILLDRNAERSRALAEDLSERFPALSIRRITVDMEDIEAVRRAADELLASPPDYLILNAGAYSIPRHKCSTGYDNVFQINFLSPYFLARKLLPAIAERGGRIVAVGSIAHNYSKSDPSDVDFSTRTKASKVYGNAKRYLMYSLWGLDEHQSSIAIAHPGITFTNITAHYPKLIFAVIKHPMKVIFMKPKKASLSIIEALFCDCANNEWIGPRFFNVWGKPKKQTVKSASPDETREICATAEKLYLATETNFIR